MRRLIILLFTLSITPWVAYGQSSITKDFQPVCDSIDVLIRDNSSVTGKLRLKSVMKRGNCLDIYFTESLGDYPWRDGEPEWFRKELQKRFPEKYRHYRLGRIYSKRTLLEDLVVPGLSSDGRPSHSAYRTKEKERPYPLIRNIDSPEYQKGLEGKNIALWQSHGRYFDENREEWIWQRPCLFQTVEDMFTQSFVLPFLVPMLENAGAYVMLPRERDIQRNEVIADFDITDTQYGYAEYDETGKWADAGPGFAALKPTYIKTENPFTMGSARKADCIMQGNRKESTAIWRPEIPERGEYAVYISYKSLPESTAAAQYTVRHMGGESHFIINQKIGGGTWIYVGTFEFDKGDDGYVSLTNETPIGYEHVKGSIVTADAVKFGGGMGNIARKGSKSEDDPYISGMPRSAEGARYWLQWAGTDSCIFSQNELENDYRDDFMSRGDWVEWISRGSDMNPSTKSGLGIPIDLAFGFHSDAGITPNDSIVGTLAIYTLRSEGSEKLPGGESRMTSREYADIVQSQIVQDIRKNFNQDWSRRGLWDRSYRESRTPSCPAMLLELLSHQNFADMKYGLDPSFRFTVSRSIYKGMLKYLSNRYGKEYAVQPLPVSDIGVRFTNDGQAFITWKDRPDPSEPTASADGYILYTEIDDRGFDKGTRIYAESVGNEIKGYHVDIEPGHIYSFRIEAFNEGGKSFPSETVCIGMPSKGYLDKTVLIVNNFDRISGPAFTDTPEYAGFEDRLDSGVPYMRDIAYIGEMYQKRRDSEYISNDNPGFGASYDDYAGRTVAGNTFDYIHKHGKSIMKAGYPFYSCSNESFCTDSSFFRSAWSIDMICGKQVTVSSHNSNRFTVFSPEMQSVLSRFCKNGGNVLVSGSHIGTDIWDRVYPIQKDSTFTEESKRFAREILGYRWVRNHAGKKGEVEFIKNDKLCIEKTSGWSFYNTINENCYSVETPDGIAPVSKSGSTFMRYSDTRLSAAVCHEGQGYRTVCIGFPIEALKEEKNIDNIISLTLQFFNR